MCHHWLNENRVLQWNQIHSCDSFDTNHDIELIGPHNEESIVPCPLPAEELPIQGNETMDFDSVPIGIREDSGLSTRLWYLPGFSQLFDTSEGDKHICLAHSVYQRHGRDVHWTCVEDLNVPMELCEIRKPTWTCTGSSHLGLTEWGVTAVKLADWDCLLYDRISAARQIHAESNLHWSCPVNLALNSPQDFGIVMEAVDWWQWDFSIP